jgi:glycosyltransferase involved in cell wall biosynthesis
MFGQTPPVRWLGAQSPDTVNAQLNAVDVVLAPFTRARNSVTGLAPLKIRDCAGAGRACVASRVAGIDQLEGEPWMFLAEPEDPLAFASAIRRALAADPVTTRLAARTFAEQRFDWRLVAEQVATLALASTTT